MYAKNVMPPREYRVPYQEQQRYSGSLRISSEHRTSAPISQDKIRRIEEEARKLVPAED